jgi:hypothetical protein
MFEGESGVSIRSAISALSLSPNPVTDHATLTFSIERPATLSVTLLSSLGQRITAIDLGNVKAGAHTRSLDLDQLPTGSYLVVISDGTGMIGVEQIVIAR